MFLDGILWPTVDWPSSTSVVHTAIAGRTQRFSSQSQFCSDILNLQGLHQFIPLDEKFTVWHPFVETAEIQLASKLKNIYLCLPRTFQAGLSEKKGSQILIQWLLTFLPCLIFPSILCCFYCWGNYIINYLRNCTKLSLLLLLKKNRSWKFLYFILMVFHGDQGTCHGLHSVIIFHVLFWYNWWENGTIYEENDSPWSLAADMYILSYLLQK